jgi:hypothetical protein
MNVGYLNNSIQGSHNGEDKILLSSWILFLGDGFMYKKTEFLCFRNPLLSSGQSDYPVPTVITNTRGLRVRGTAHTNSH